MSDRLLPATDDTSPARLMHMMGDSGNSRYENRFYSRKKSFLARFFAHSTEKEEKEKEKEKEGC